MIGKVTKHKLNKNIITIHLNGKHDLKKKIIFIKIDNNFIPFSIDKYSYKSHKVLDIIISDKILKQIITKTYGCEVYLEEKNKVTPKPRDKDDDKLINFTAYNSKDGKELGKVISTINLSSQGLLEIQDKNNKSKFLVPMNENLIIKTNFKQKKIFLSLPEGLKEL